MSQTLTDKVLKAILAEDPDALGNITIKSSSKKEIWVSGTIHSKVLSNDDATKIVTDLLEADGAKVFVTSLIKSGLTVVDVDSLSTTENIFGELDEVDVLFYGLMSAREIEISSDFKKLNHETLVKVKRAIEVVGFVAPLVLDSTLKVIDGNLRLSAIRKLYGENTEKKIPVIVINDSGAKADFLRLTLNRSSEFQRWNYSDVDAYVDNWPQLQPVLEPLGFFANKILPTSFFGNTIIDYKIDEYNDQQKMYSQDIGLAAWAQYQRERILAENEAKKAEVDRKKAPTAGMKSLFDILAPSEKLIETKDMDTILNDHALEQRVVAGIITDNYDEKRKKEKAAAGQAWQTSRRGSKQKAADKRAEAEESEEVEANE